MISSYRTGVSRGVNGVVADRCRNLYESESSNSSLAPITNPSREVTALLVYACEIFGTEDLRTKVLVRLNCARQAAAAMLIGVLGVGGVGSWEDGRVISFASLAGKGSEFRKLCFFVVTKLEKLEAILED